MAAPIEREPPVMKETLPVSEVTLLTGEAWTLDMIWVPLGVGGEIGCGSAPALMGSISPVHSRGISR
jgi:hypothetical protein